ncbi:hypothetical protein CIHG_02974 [Coccidioides immitis H538.4]|uniref:Orc1-like AAA ATPase domain-containing protein n=1 Tax=Coccidioides immitis H538.4 TaxID=396776 RepID=A0A0J8RKM7_COCIT|nr:hypothetical protein CIHG_02974 [Coccidioides immitis H538.4]
MPLGLLRTRAVFGAGRSFIRPNYAPWTVTRIRLYGSQDLSPGGPPQPGQETPEMPERDSRSDEPTLRSTLLRMFESAATTFASIAVLGLAGYSYYKYYKYLVLKKMDNAFNPGDPVLEVAGVAPSMGTEGSDTTHWIQREEQTRVDEIINGTTKGRYFLLIGEKGTGKSSMILDAMRKIDGAGVAMFEAHADLEIFRVRLGKALDFEYHEDIRGPRDATALLDIERALNKLEKVALRRRRKSKTPLILIVNSTHLVSDDEDGRDLLEMLQQRAEQWAASNLITIVFNSDDYWVYERLKRYASRMEVIPVPDLPKDKAMRALYQFRAQSPQ